jgi:iron complex transport system permease protein
MRSRVLLKTKTQQPPAPSATLTAWLTVTLVCVAVLAVVLSLTVGAKFLSFSQLFEVAFQPGVHSDAATVVFSRVPRTVNGVIAGAALAMTGALLQYATHNPLADSGLLGLNAGSAVFVVAAIGLTGVTGIAGLSVWALVGAAAAAAVVHLVAARSSGGANPLTLALAGAAVTAGFGAITSVALLRSESTFDAFRIWQVGSLSARSITQATSVLPILVIGVVLGVLLIPGLDRLRLGDATATTLGTRPARVRLGSMLAAVMLTGGVTTLVGPVGFVGLVVPHGLRLMVGQKASRVVPLSLIAGPVVVLLADVIGRVAALPGEVPVGVMTALFGGPVFIILLVTYRRRTRNGASL